MIFHYSIEVYYFLYMREWQVDLKIFLEILQEYFDN